MTFHERGFRTIGVMGVPATDSAAGNARQWHTMVTNDDRATVETANYLDALLSPKRVKNGDLITIAGDQDGTPFKVDYIIDISSSAGHVLIRREADVGGRAARAVVPTVAGLTTGLLYDTDKVVEATSADANYWLTLPLATANTRGREIMIWVVASTNCELRTPASANQKINNVACGSSGNEALLTHSQYYIARQHLDDAWLLQAFTALGAVATAIIPD